MKRPEQNTNGNYHYHCLPNSKHFPCVIESMPGNCSLGCAGSFDVDPTEVLDVANGGGDDDADHLLTRGVGHSLKRIEFFPKVLRWGLKCSGQKGASLQAWKKPMAGDLIGWKMTYDHWKTATLARVSALLKGRCFLMI